MKDTNDKSFSLNRRKLLAGTGLAAAGIATLGLPGVSHARASEQTQMQWDAEVDLICVGSGAAACTAAVTAAAAGAEVLVLEKMPMTGGTTGKSGGVVWIPNHKFIRAAGLEDKKEDCLKYMARYAYPELYDPASATLGLSAHRYSLLEAFYDNGSRMLDAMEQVEAVKFKPYKMWAVNENPPDYAEHLPENKANNVRALEPDQGAGAGSGGGSLAYQLEAWLQKHNVPILLEHKAQKIIMQDGRALGLEVQQGGQTRLIKARKGIVFGTGGYVHNLDLINTHQRPGIYGSCAAAGATGDLLPMAQQIGARMGRLDTAWRTQVVLEEALANRAMGLGVFFAPGDSMIQVNKYGQRCVNEKRNYNDRTKAHFVFDPVKAEYPNLFTVMVFDERTLNRYRGAYPIPYDARESSALIVADGVQSLSEKLKQRLQALGGQVGSYRLDESFATNLQASIERFNAFAEAGKDEEFSRGLNEYDRVWQKVFSPVSDDTEYPDNPMPNPTMHPLKTDKLYAILLAPGALDTSGGPETTAQGQIMAADGTPIPGLYGAGNCVASPVGPAYMGAGGTISLAMTFGWLAARHALEAEA